MAAMTPTERKLLRAIVALPERTVISKPRRGIWMLGRERDCGARARWQTFDALKRRGYIAITYGFAMATYVEATEAGRQAAPTSGGEV